MAVTGNQARFNRPNPIKHCGPILRPLFPGQEGMGHNAIKEPVKTVGPNPNESNTRLSVAQRMTERTVLLPGLLARYHVRLLEIVIRILLSIGRQSKRQ